MDKELWIIHGANSTPLSFSYILDQLTEDYRFQDWHVVRISYDCQDNLPALVEQLSTQMPRDKEIFLLGHSLGGVLAVAASQAVKFTNPSVTIKAVVTLSSPLGGSESATYLQWLFPGYHLFRNIAPSSKLISGVKSVGAVVPTLSLVTSAGNNPLFHEANDGVVTVKSQRSLDKATFIEVPYNHFEVLLNPDVVDHIKNVLFYPYSVSEEYVKLLPGSSLSDDDSELGI